MFRFVRLKSASRHFELIEAARPISQEYSKSGTENRDETHYLIEVIHRQFSATSRNSVNFFCVHPSRLRRRGYRLGLAFPKSKAALKPRHERRIVRSGVREDALREFLLIAPVPV